MVIDLEVEREHFQTESAPEGWRAASGGILSIVVAVAGHVVTAQRSHPGWGLVLFGVALILFLLSPFRARARAIDHATTASPAQDENRPLVRRTMWRMALLANGVILSAIAFWAFTGNRLDRGFWFWLMGIVYFVLALAEVPQSGWRGWLRAWLNEPSWRTVAAVLLITGLAAFFRLYKLNAIPVEMTSDHAEKLLDVFDVLNGRRAIFFPRNTGREALQFYLTAAIIRWSSLEIGHMALKIGTAAFGILTVPLTYLLGKELIGRRVGLVAAFLLAIAHWHVTITRVGLRFPFTAAFAAPALYFLFRSLRQNRRNDWLAAGAILGAGLHTYTAMRIVPLLFILLVVIRFAYDVSGRLISIHRSEYRPITAVTLTWRFWGNAMAGASVCLVIFLPLLRYMLEFPESFWYRAVSRAQNGPTTVLEMWQTFWLNTRNALLMFNYRGDVVPMNTIPETAVLGPVTGGLFVLGFFWILWRVVRHGERTAVYLGFSFFVLLLPSILSLSFPGENPSVVRTGGAVPLIMIIAALPLVAILNALVDVARGGAQGVAFLFLVLVLGTATAFNYDWYFHRYDENVRRSLWNATEMGAVLTAFEDSGGSLQNAYHVAYPHWVDTRNIAINAGHITWRNVVTDLSQIGFEAQRPGRKIYLVFPQHQAALKVLSEVYPHGQATLYVSERPGKSFYVFEVPARESSSGPPSSRQVAEREGRLRAPPSTFRLLR